MAVKRIVANIETDAPASVASFYTTLFGLDLVMDMGWISTVQASVEQQIQLSAASEGGSGTPVPTLSIEVDNLDETYAHAVTLGIKIEYGPVDEPWGVRRFYVRDPAGTLINVLSHMRD